MSDVVLFVCVENAGRSQMAEAFFRKHFGDSPLRAASAGSRPSGRLNPDVVEVMREIGIDISEQRSKSVGEFQECFAVCTMGCGDDCPLIAAKFRSDQNFADPKGKTLEDIRRIRDEIEEFVVAWGNELFNAQKALLANN